MIKNHYKTLGLPDFCDDQERITNAYRSIYDFCNYSLKQSDPELAAKKINEISAAVDCLQDPVKKKPMTNR